MTSKVKSAYCDPCKAKGRGSLDLCDSCMRIRITSRKTYIRNRDKILNKVKKVASTPERKEYLKKYRLAKREHIRRINEEYVYRKKHGIKLLAEERRDLVNRELGTDRMWKQYILAPDANINKFNPINHTSSNSSSIKKYKEYVTKRTLTWIDRDDLDWIDDEEMTESE